MAEGEKKPKILVVEDNEDWGQLWKEVVSRMGYEAVVVDTVAEALDKLQTIIILGVIADGMNETYESLVKEALENGIVGQNIFVISANLLRHGRRKKDGVSFLPKVPKILNAVVFQQIAQV